MKIYPETKIFIICPGNMHSGASELMHQLASALIKMNYNAFMCYLPADANFDPANPVDPFYKKYHIPFVPALEMDPKNILIVSESSTRNLYISDNIQKVLWWLSIDSWINSLCAILKNFKPSVLTEGIPKFFYFDKSDSAINHWVQSNYAEQFIKKNGIADEQISKIGDYLNPAFLSRAANVDISQKENIVVYNPVKGFEFTQKLLKSAPNINWQAIRNMTPEQVQQLLARAKVYIDFGTHSGRDRIPREAAVSGCVVITGKRGAAANDKDVAIDDSFKFDDSNENVPKILDKINDIFENFRFNYDRQAAYREEIMHEPEEFYKNLKAVFNYKEPEKPLIKTAILQGITKKGLTLTNILSSKNYGYLPIFLVDNQAAYRKGANIKSEFIFEYQNTNYFVNNRIVIPIISLIDAVFLYQEHRIDKFALFVPDEMETTIVKKALTQVQVNLDDLIILEQTESNKYYGAK